MMETLFRPTITRPVRHAIDAPSGWLHDRVPGLRKRSTAVQRLPGAASSM